MLLPNCFYFGEGEAISCFIGEGEFIGMPGEAEPSHALPACRDERPPTIFHRAGPRWLCGVLPAVLAPGVVSR